MDSAGVYSANGKGCGKYGETCSVKTPVRGICPMGWHLPSNTEWETLFTAVGGPFTAGKILKSESGWAFDGNGTDDVGFSALPAGVRGNYGNIYGDGRYAHFWSSTEYAHIMGLNFNYESASLGYDGVDNGVSVRCVKD